MNRNSLARAITNKTKLSNRQAENLIIAFGAAITDALERNDKVVYSNFGSFYAIEYPSKTINHPKNGEKLIMLPTKVVKWMPSDSLKKLVAGRVVPDFIESEDDNMDEDQNSAVEIKINVTKSSPPTDDVSTEDKSKHLENAHKEDDIEKYHSYAKDAHSQPVNIYEELLSDGDKEYSTIQDTIKVHHDSPAAQDGSNQEQNSNHSPGDSEDAESNNNPKTAFEILRQKLGLVSDGSESNESEEEFKKKATIASNAEITNAPDKIPEDVNRQPILNKIHETATGLFDKNTAKTPDIIPPTPQSATSQIAEEKIEEIKEEIKATPSQSVKNNNQEHTEQQNHNDTADTKRVPSDTPLFSGTEASLNFDKTRVEYKDLSKTIVPKDLLSKIPENIARSYKAVAFEQENDITNVAMVDPEDVETREMIKRILGEKIKIYLATEADISSILNQYQGLESEVSNAIASAEGEDEDDKNADGKQQVIETVSDDAPAAKIVSSLLKRAIRDKASDVHIEPTEKEVEVRFRLDGVLRKKVSLPKDIQASVTSRIKILSNMKIDEQRVPQDGRFNMHVDNRRVDFRVSSMPVAFGEKIVMRILDKESGVLTIEQLGMSGSGLKTLEENLTKSHGMVLVTGPTGSGKSTTLYAMIQKVFNEGVNIITLEDPIEYQMKGINQSQVNSDIGYTFAAGLRSILRQDPDIIMLGEIRDKETAEMAVHAALTGHVVLSTLHTNDAAGAAPRMIDMGVEPFLLTSSINVVVGQRLVRKLCQDCKEEQIIPEEEMALVKKEIERMPKAENEVMTKKELKFFKGKGCKNCDNSGYKGRIGISEVLGITPEMQQLILKRVSSEELNNLAISQGMVTMIQDGIIKAANGVTSIEEVWRATKN